MSDSYFVIITFFFLLFKVRYFISQKNRTLTSSWESGIATTFKRISTVGGKNKSVASDVTRRQSVRLDNKAAEILKEEIDSG